MTGSKIDPSMLWPLLIMAVAMKFYYAANLITRSRVTLLEQDLRKGWTRDVIAGDVIEYATRERKA